MYRVVNSGVLIQLKSFAVVLPRFLHFDYEYVLDRRLIDGSK